MRSTATKRAALMCLVLLFIAAPAHAGTGKKGLAPQGGIFFESNASQWGKALILKNNTSSPLQAEKLTVLPVSGQLTSEFGLRKLSRKSATRMHKGIDISAPKGTEVVASAGGTVVAAERHKAYGQVVDIDHGNGLVTRYAHLNSYCVVLGEQVQAGTPLGTVGRTGRTTGPNLHFETIVDGKQVDPLQTSLWANGFAAATPALHMANMNSGRQVAEVKTTPSRQAATVKSAPKRHTTANKRTPAKSAARTSGLTVASKGKGSTSSANTLP